MEVDITRRSRPVSDGRPPARPSSATTARAAAEPGLAGPLTCVPRNPREENGLWAEPEDHPKLRRREGSYCDLFLLGAEGLLEVLVFLKERLHAVQGVSQVFVQQEGLERETEALRETLPSFHP